jgi:cytochrome P450
VSAAAADPPVEYNPFDPAFDRDPYPAYKRLRERDPVHYWEPGAAWVLTRYDDVSMALRDPRFGTSFLEWQFLRRRIEQAREHPFGMLIARGLMCLPAVDHTRVRRLVNPIFSPRGVARFRGLIQKEVDALLDRKSGAESLDVIADLAALVPLRVMSDILCVDRADEERFRRFAAAQMNFRVPMFTDEEFAQHLEKVADGVALFRQRIDEKRRDLGQDLLSDLIRAEEAGERLDIDELLALLAMLLTAGGESTTHLIGFGVLNLLRHPDALRAVQGDLSLIDAAVDEVLRFDSLGKNGALRFALEDMELRGKQLRKGDCIFPSVPAAMRDPEAFPDPDAFDIFRDQSRSITWGLGPHYCLGAALAKLTAVIAVRSILERFPRLSLAGEPEFEPHMVVRKMISLPVRIRD